MGIAKDDSERLEIHNDLPSDHGLFVKTCMSSAKDRDWVSRVRVGVDANRTCHVARECYILHVGFHL